MRDSFNAAASVLGADDKAAAIEQILGEQIAFGNQAPLFTGSGEPLLDTAGRPVCISYTHAAALAGAVIGRDGPAEPRTTKDVADLAVPFWQPTDVIMLTSDGYIFAAMRGNATNNGIGRCLTAAAGFPKVVDGKPEDARACGHREMREETGLRWEDVAAREVDLGLITDRPLQKYNIKTQAGDKTLPGVVPTIVRTYAVQTKQDAGELFAAISSNYESAGYVAIKAEDFAKLAKDPTAEVPALFAASATLKAPAPAAGEALSVLRAALENPATPKALSSPDNHPLQAPVAVRVTGSDFMHNGSAETLQKTVKAAQALGVLAAEPVAVPVAANVQRLRA